MAILGIIFDLFHTLTAPEADWSDLPPTSDRPWDRESPLEPTAGRTLSAATPMQ
jgi:hypothetical protein